jgi:RimJ/RimL family protein N-acetyltransferase
MNLNRLWLLVLESNAHAIRLYQKQGFRLEGRMRQAVFRDGRYVDYLVMSILDGEYRTR